MLRPLARQGRQDEVRCCRDEAGAVVAAKLVAALKRALQTLQRQPAIGSPMQGREPGLPQMRTRLVDGFPLAFWYVELEMHIDVVRLVSRQQDALGIDVDAR
ncbi:MAG TPA: type II toxin-antitoxin system RelE/ParE family toxin [Rubrivivax sp.]|nr:type II toxin-antitoxin system RelE/ParE family toxin [Rubrivivax sp.]